MFAGLAFVPASQAQDSNRYQTLKKTQPSETAGRVEVLEFFAYTCPHCKAMEPLVTKWADTLPEDVALQRVPVAFNSNMVDLQKLYYTLENLERLDLHPKVFAAIHDEDKAIFTESAIIDWAAEQGLDRENFSDVFGSFGIQSRVSRANELAKNYEIDGTPTLAVGGKYVTSPTLTNSYAGTIEEADSLIEQARERGQP
ncbi:MAG TPA: thiol:disulfide interchange protein DsbA/DsbL [Burkholderiaceae bacterium]|nr:thiol:disulfide interchange protein DsbA/DsbL [Burkholderiaceae bacterium]